MLGTPLRPSSAPLARSAMREYSLHSNVCDLLSSVVARFVT